MNVKVRRRPQWRDDARSHAIFTSKESGRIQRPKKIRRFCSKKRKVLEMGGELSLRHRGDIIKV